MIPPYTAFKSSIIIMAKPSPPPDFWRWVGSSSTGIPFSPSVTECIRFQIELSRVHMFAGSMLVFWPCGAPSLVIRPDDLAN